MIIRFQLGARVKAAGRKDLIGAGMSLAYLTVAVERAYAAARDKNNGAMLSALHDTSDYADTLGLQCPELSERADAIYRGASGAVPYVAHLREPDEDEWRELQEWTHKAMGLVHDLVENARALCAK